VPLLNHTGLNFSVTFGKQHYNCSLILKVRFVVLNFAYASDLHFSAKFYLSMTFLYSDFSRSTEDMVCVLCDFYMNLYFYFAAWRGAEYCDEYVCLFVCLSSLITADLHQILCAY